MLYKRHAVAAKLITSESKGSSQQKMASEGAASTTEPKITKVASDGEASNTEQLLWTPSKECYVYQIPPLKNENGHRANDWNVEKWLWQGALKVTCKGDILYIILHDPKTGELFATCPVEKKGSKAVDQVIDSSRYPRRERSCQSSSRNAAIVRTLCQ